MLDIWTRKNSSELLTKIKSLALGMAVAPAIDRITVDGVVVGYCYREEPDNASDSGWRFFAGDEGNESLSIPDNLGIYDVNTISNYDPGIITILGTRVGSAFDRRGDSFRLLDDPHP